MAEKLVKKCFIKLHPLPQLNNFDDADSISSDEDLPPLSFGFKLSKCDSDKENNKSVNELFEAQKLLIKELKEEKVKKQIVKQEFHETEDVGSCSPSVSSCTHVDSNYSLEQYPDAKHSEEEIKIFCRENYLQFFNFDDITLTKCGYSSQYSAYQTPFENVLLSLKQGELKCVLSSALMTCHFYHITSLKHFVTYVLRTICVHNNKICVSQCENILNNILSQHPDFNKMEFTSADFFTLIFNYGVDVEGCQVLHLIPDLRGYLPRTKSEQCYRNEIPSTWLYNMKALLNALANIICFCKFTSKDLFNILLFFLWMSCDKALLYGDLYYSIQKCVNTVLERFIEEDWCNVCLRLAKTLMSLKFSSRQKFGCICSMVKTIPKVSDRGVHLRKVISSLALKEYCADAVGAKWCQADSGALSTLELQNLMEHISNMEPVDHSIAVNFLDICLSNLKEMPEVELINVLKCSENLMKRDPAQLKIVKIYSRLEIIRTQSLMVSSLNVQSEVKTEPCEVSQEPEENGEINITEHIYGASLPTLTKAACSSVINSSNDYENVSEPLMPRLFPEIKITSKDNILPFTSTHSKKLDSDILKFATSDPRAHCASTFSKNDLSETLKPTLMHEVTTLSEHQVMENNPTNQKTLIKSALPYQLNLSPEINITSKNDILPSVSTRSEKMDFDIINFASSEENSDPKSHCVSTVSETDLSETLESSVMHEVSLSEHQVIENNPTDLNTSLKSTSPYRLNISPEIDGMSNNDILPFISAHSEKMDSAIAKFSSSEESSDHRTHCKSIINKTDLSETLEPSAMHEVSLSEHQIIENNPTDQNTSLKSTSSHGLNHIPEIEIISKDGILPFISTRSEKTDSDIVKFEFSEESSDYRTHCKSTISKTDLSEISEPSVEVLLSEHQIIEKNPTDQNTSIKSASPYGLNHFSEIEITCKNDILPFISTCSIKMDSDFVEFTCSEESSDHRTHYKSTVGKTDLSETLEPSVVQAVSLSKHQNTEIAPIDQKTLMLSTSPCSATESGSKLTGEWIVSEKLNESSVNQLDQLSCTSEIKCVYNETEKTNNLTCEKDKKLELSSRKTSVAHNNIKEGKLRQSALSPAFIEKISDLSSSLLNVSKSDSIFDHQSSVIKCCDNIIKGESVEFNERKLQPALKQDKIQSSNYNAALNSVMFPNINNVSFGLNRSGIMIDQKKTDQNLEIQNKAKVQQYTQKSSISEFMDDEYKTSDINIGIYKESNVNVSSNRRISGHHVGKYLNTGVFPKCVNSRSFTSEGTSRSADFSSKTAGIKYNQSMENYIKLKNISFNTMERGNRYSGSKLASSSGITQSAASTSFKPLKRKVPHILYGPKNAKKRHLSSKHVFLPSQSTSEHSKKVINDFASSKNYHIENISSDDSDIEILSVIDKNKNIDKNEVTVVYIKREEIIID